jgi:hypothetical protein
MESIGLSVEALQKILAPEIAHQALAAADLLKRKARSHRRPRRRAALPREHHAAQPGAGARRHRAAVRGR